MLAIQPAAIVLLGSMASFLFPPGAGAQNAPVHVAAGESVIKCPSPLNVLKVTHTSYQYILSYPLFLIGGTVQPSCASPTSTPGEAAVDCATAGLAPISPSALWGVTCGATGCGVAQCCVAARCRDAPGWTSRHGDDCDYIVERGRPWAR